LPKEFMGSLDQTGLDKTPFSMLMESLERQWKKRVAQT